jgi:hypothetical protein
MKPILILALTSLLLLPCSRAQFPTVPSIMQKGYFTVDPAGVKLDVKFRIERGRVLVDQVFANGRANTIEIVLTNLTALSLTPPLPGGKWLLLVSQNGGGERVLLFNSKEDGDAVAAYLSEMSGVPKDSARTSSPEQVSRPASTNQASSSRTNASHRFSCPPRTQPSCGDLNELLRNDDPEILRYAKKGDGSVLACFSTEGAHEFAIVSLEKPTRRSRKSLLEIVSFQNGIESDSSFFWLKWVTDNLSFISESDAKESPIGSINDSELHLERSFRNRMGTETQQKTAIRWSTGKYVRETFSKDEKGAFQSFMREGICAPLELAAN